MDGEPVCREGLRRTALAAERRLTALLQKTVDYSLHFELDWRKMNQLWKPQRTKQEARAVAGQQQRLLDSLSPRWREERMLVGEPLNLAWMMSLSPEGRRSSLLNETVNRFQYEQLYVVRFFAAEGITL